MRRMKRHLVCPRHLGAWLVLVILAAATACDPAERALVLELPEGAQSIEAHTASGEVFVAERAQGGGEVRLRLGSDEPVVLVVIKESGGRVPVHFAPREGAAAERSVIPSFLGDVDLGLVEPCACGPSAMAFQPARNPLEQIDTDLDGLSDFADEDDDDDALLDDADEDLDGNGVADASEDVDDNGDCIPNACDRDGDGVLDAAQPTDGDADEDTALDEGSLDEEEAPPEEA